VKSFRTQEVVVGAWTDGRGERRNSLGALLLGIPDDGGLRYVGKVGTGFSARARADLLEDLKPLATSENPFASVLPSADARAAHFVRPELVGEVEFGEWTTVGRLRHPTWRGLRPDKSTHDVVVE
jgi:bifunctional non-homologous end joining protein LigD